MIEKIYIPTYKELVNRKHFLIFRVGLSRYFPTLVVREEVVGYMEFTITIIEHPASPENREWIFHHLILTMTFDDDLDLKDSETFGLMLKEIQPMKLSIEKLDTFLEKNPEMDQLGW